MCPCAQDASSTCPRCGRSAARPAAGSGGRTVAYPAMSHGWVTRGDLDDEAVANDVEAALAEMLAFLRAHV